MTWTHVQSVATHVRTYLPIPEEAVERLDVQATAAVLDGRLVYLDVSQDGEHAQLPEISAPITLRLHPSAFLNPAFRASLLRISDDHPLGLRFWEPDHALRETSRVDDYLLAEVASIPQLQMLDLHLSSGVTDEGLIHLSGLTQLRALILWGTQVSDEGLVHLGELSKLQTLVLGGTHVTAAGLVHLSTLTQLQNLDLRGREVTDQSLTHLAGLTQLRNLDIRGSEVTDAGLIHLSGLTQLQSLDLTGAQVSDAGLNQLSGLTQLRSLKLWSTQVSDIGVSALRETLPQAEILH